MAGAELVVDDGLDPQAFPCLDRRRRVAPDRRPQLADVDSFAVDDQVADREGGEVLAGFDLNLDPDLLAVFDRGDLFPSRVDDAGVEHLHRRLLGSPG